MKPTLLVVDDQKLIRDIFFFAFEEFRVLQASSGSAALDIIRGPNMVDAVILDVMMSGLNGLDVLREIKQAHPECVVVMMTGHATVSVAVEALRAHADEFVEKPFDIENVRDVLHKLIAGRSNRGAKASSEHYVKASRARRFIERNYNKKISLKDIADDVYLCPKYVSRLFRTKEGKTVTRYKMELKISRAKDLLRKSSLTVGQIAFTVGYQDPDAFMKIFKRVTGMRPLEYREGCVSESAGSGARALSRKTGARAGG